MGKVKVAIIGVVLVALIGIYYFYLSNYKSTNDETLPTAVQDVLLKNLDNDYPKTPKEVVKYYSEISKCLRNESYNDTQFEQMADKMRELFDDELLEQNPRETHLESLKKEIKAFEDGGYSLYSYTLSSTMDVEEYSKDGKKCANLYCTYSFKNGADYSATKYVFVLRMDSNDKHWKILEFEVASEEK